MDRPRRCRRRPRRRRESTGKKGIRQMNPHKKPYRSVKSSFFQVLLGLITNQQEKNFEEKKDLNFHLFKVK